MRVAPGSLELSIQPGERVSEVLFNGARTDAETTGHVGVLEAAEPVELYDVTEAVMFRGQGLQGVVKIEQVQHPVVPLHFNRLQGYPAPAPDLHAVVRRGGVRVAMILHNGMPVELLEFSDS